MFALRFNNKNNENMFLCSSVITYFEYMLFCFDVMFNALNIISMDFIKAFAVFNFEIDITAFKFS